LLFILLQKPPYFIQSTKHVEIRSQNYLNKDFSTDMLGDLLPFV